MSNNTAQLKRTLVYTDEHGKARTEDPITTAAPYQAQSHGNIDVPDTTAAGARYAVPFGSVDTAATALVVENGTGQDIEIDPPAVATGTLISGTKNIALPNVAGDHLSVVRTASGGTPGELSVVRVDDATVTVNSWKSAGIQDLDTSTVKAFAHRGTPLHLATGGKVEIAMPTAPSTGKMTKFAVATTAEQSGAGKVAYDVFGDAV